MTGKYYLWVTPETLSEIAENAQTESVVSTGPFYFDNEKPTWKTENLNIDKENQIVTVDIIGTDNQEYVGNTIDISDIKVIVDGTDLTSTIPTLRPRSALFRYDDGDVADKTPCRHKYRIILAS